MTGQPLGFAIGIALVPVVALGGAIYGAVVAESAEAVAEAEAALQKALAEAKIQEALPDRVYLVARDQTRNPVILLGESGPTARTEGLRHPPSAEAAPDTFLEVSVTALRFVGNGINPPLALMMNVETRLVPAEDRGTHYEAALEYRSRTRKFTEWAADNAQPFREELERAIHSLAERIVEEAFLLYPIP